MTAFEDIIKLRNKGYSQQEIAQKIGISLRTAQRYLKLGKISSSRFGVKPRLLLVKKR